MQFKHPVKCKVLISFVLIFLVGCSKTIDECNSPEAKANFERIVQKILIDANKPQLRMRTINVIESTSGVRSGLKGRACVADIEWYYKEGDKEYLIEKTTLGFDITQNPLNKDEIILVPDVIKLNLFYINDLIGKGEELAD